MKRVYLKADQVGSLPRLSSGERPDDRAKLVQERDWDKYLASLEPKKVTRSDLERLARRFQ